MGIYTVKGEEIYGLVGYTKLPRATINLSSDNDSISVGDSKTITVTKDSTGTISIVNNNPSIISASLSDNLITVTGLSGGSASININVAKDSEYYGNSITYNCRLFK